MSITINGRTYTTLEDELYIGGKQLGRVEVNGRQVYPDGPGYCEWLTKYIEGTLSGAIIIPDITYVGEYAFVNKDTAYTINPITLVSLAKCERISGHAFYDCGRLRRIVMPLCSYIGPSALFFCTQLSDISFPKCERIDTGAFGACYSLASISFPMCSYIGAYAFEQCICRSLTSVSFPMCQYIGSGAFRSCHSLISISFPMCSYIGSDAFGACSSLTFVSFSICSFVGSFAFRSCRELMSVYFMAPSVVTIGIDAFYSTPIGGYGSVPGYIYVPISLYDQYIMSSVWSRYSSHIIGT